MKPEIRATRWQCETNLKWSDTSGLGVLSGEVESYRSP